MNDTHDHGPSQMAGSGDWRSWNPSRRRFLTLTGLAVGGTVIGVSAAGCGTAQTGSQQGTGEQKGRPGASGETLFVAGSGYDLFGTFRVGLDTYWHNRAGLRAPAGAPTAMIVRPTLSGLVKAALRSVGN